MSIAQTAPSAAPAGVPSSPWDIAAFRFYAAGIVSVTLANQLQATVVSYQMYELTKNPLALGLVDLAEALPFMALALPGGYFADRHDRRQLSLLLLVVAALLSVVLLALSLARGALGTAAHISAIYTTVAGLGICRSFLQPARAALNAEVLPPALYAKAIALRVSCIQLAMVSGPALGGLLYAAVGPHGAYATAAALLAFAWLQTWRIPSLRATPFTRTQKPFLSGIGEGLRYLIADRLLFPALLLDLFAVLFGGATALLPVFANEILHVGSRGFGFLRAAPAVGTLLASLWLAQRPPLQRAGRTLLWMTAGFGLAIIAFGLSRSFALSLFCLACAGVCDMFSVVVRGTLLQLRVPGSLMGRVASINQLFIGSSNELGAFESGLAARLLGAVPAVVLGGTVTMLVAATAAMRAPELRKLGALDPWTDKKPDRD